MPRAVWSGSISFGLVNVPVKAYTAVRDHRSTSTSSRRRAAPGSATRRCRTSPAIRSTPTTSSSATRSARAGTSPSSASELDDLRPESTKAIEVSDFVALDDIDPIYYERTYWLGPDGEAAEQGLPAPARGDGGPAAGRHRQRGDAQQAVPRRHPPARRRARHVDDALRRRGRRRSPTSTSIPSRRSKPDAKAAKLAARSSTRSRPTGIPSATTTPTPRSCSDIIERKDKGKDVVVEDERGADEDGEGARPDGRPRGQRGEGEGAALEQRQALDEAPGREEADGSRRARRSGKKGRGPQVGVADSSR